MRVLGRLRQELVVCDLPVLPLLKLQALLHRLLLDGAHYVAQSFLLLNTKSQSYLSHFRVKLKVLLVHVEVIFARVFPPVRLSLSLLLLLLLHLDFVLYCFLHHNLSQHIVHQLVTHLTI